MARKIEVQITGNSSSFERALSRSGSAASGWGSKVGRTLKVGAAVAATALGGLGAFAVKAAIDFESSFAGVRKTVDGTEREFGKLSKGLLDMSRRIPVNVNELNRIAEAAGQLGVSKSGIIQFTEVVAKLGVSSNLAGEEGAAMLAKFANITGLKQDEYDNLGATIVALGNAGASTEQDIAAMGLRLAAAGTQVGLTAPQVLGLSNALSSVGIEAEAGGTAMSKAMLQINNAVSDGGKKLEGFAKVSGMTSSQFAAQWKKDPGEALAAFFDGLAKVKDEGGNLNQTIKGLGFSGERLIDTLGRGALAHEQFRKSLRLGESAWKANVALNKEAAERFKTTASQLQLLKNNLSAVAIVAGSKLLPAFNRALLAATGFASKLFEAKGFRAKLNVVWEGIQEAGQTITSKIGAAVGMIDWAAVWGKAQGIASGLATKLEETDWAAVGSAIGSGIAAGVGTAGEIGKKLGDAATIAVRSVDWEKLGVAMGPGLAAAVAAGFATILDPGFWLRNWELVLALAAAVFPVGRLGKLALVMLGPFKKLGGDLVLGLVSGIETFAPRMATALLAGLTKLPGIAMGALRLLQTAVGKVFAKIGSVATFAVKVLGISAAISGITGLAASVGRKLADVNASIRDAGARWITAAGNAAKGIVTAVINFLTALPGKALAKLGEVVAAVMQIGPSAAAAGSSIGGKIVSGILSGITSLPGQLASKLGGYITGAISAAGSKLRGSGDFMFTKHVVGVPLAQGVVDGWQLGIKPLGPAITRTLTSAVGAGGAIVDGLSAKLAGQAAKWARFGAALTPVEAQLQAMQAAEARRGLQSALLQAREELGKARSVKGAKERAAAITAAAEGLRQAELAITTARLEGVAERERVGRDKQVAIATAAIERMRVAVGTRTEALGTSFGKLGEQLQRAFGARTTQLVDALTTKFDRAIEAVRRWQAELTGAERAVAALQAGIAAQGPTASEAALTVLDEGEAKRSRELAVASAEAQLEVARAMTVTSAEEAKAKADAIMQAEEGLRTAQLGITRARLTELAATERAARDASNAERLAALQLAATEERAERDRQAAERITALEAEKASELRNLQEMRQQQETQLQAQLAQLQVQLAKRPGEYTKIHGRIVALMAKHGVDMTNSGELLGEAFAKGLDKAQNDVRKSAAELARIVAHYLRLHSPAKAGPLATLDTWWAGMASTLVGGLDVAEVRRAAEQIAALMVPGYGGRTAPLGAGYGTATGPAGGPTALTIQFHGPVYSDERGIELLTSKIRRTVQQQLGRN